ncbi:Guanine nucleotide exchange factor vav2 [Cichlidogyrus casuarinus]|uniref:Guanine nucleotide exchange factor vav2 n=1 Tax=Cichlidogyrus casuarinus TaxID=1844966 RepID=A0ABD2PYJ4_9PLAT
MSDKIRECVRWLQDCRVFGPNSQFANAAASPMDLITALRDGVVLCNLLFSLSDGDIDYREVFCSNPEDSQYLCCQNIRIFLTLCVKNFGIKEEDLFEEDDLFQAMNFGKVIDLLSKLSIHEKATSRGIAPFPRKDVPAIETKASNGSSFDLSMFPYQEDDPDVQERIYDSVVCSSQLEKKASSTKNHKYECCRNEIIATENSYLTTLDSLLNNYKIPLSDSFSVQELEQIFSYIPSLLEVHKRIAEKLNALSSPKPTCTLANIFKCHRDKLLLYGDYSGHLSEARSYISEIMRSSPEKRRRLEVSDDPMLEFPDCRHDNDTVGLGLSQCVMYADVARTRAKVHFFLQQCREKSKDKFELIDLLTVPIQRVTRYHLLLADLLKNADDNCPEKRELKEAWELMKELAEHTNIVKGDYDAMRHIDKIQSRLVPLSYLSLC